MFAPEGWLMVNACEATDATDFYIEALETSFV